MMNFSLNKNAIRKINVFVIWLVIWGIIAHFIGAFYFPSPLETAAAIWRILADYKSYLSIVHSIVRVGIVFVLSALLGIVLGVFCGLNKRVFEFFQPLLVSIKSIPVISFIIIAIIHLQSSNVPIFIGVLVCLPIVCYNTIEGVKNVDNALIEMGNVYEVSLARLIREIYIPSTLPYIAAGLLTSVGLSWRIVVASEVLSTVRHSIGFNLYSAMIFLQTADAFAWTVIIVVLSLFFEKTLALILNRATKQKTHKVAC